MSEQQTIQTKASDENELSGTQQTVQIRGDYTRYFYQNIERLWEAVTQLQDENDRQKNASKEASQPQNTPGELKIIYDPKTAPKIGTAEDAYKQLTDIKDATKEIFIAFYLNTKNKIIAREIISIGILNASLIHPRELYRGAILHNAQNIILAHNHPSGDPTPSTQDIDVTKLMRQAGELIGIELLDHIIVGHDTYKSLKELNEL